MTQNKSFLQLVKVTLNIRHSLKLSEEVLLPKNYSLKKIFDLEDISNLTFVDIINNVTADKRDQISKKIDELTKAIVNSDIKTNKPFQFKIISEDVLNDIERKFYTNQYKENNVIRYEFLDVKDILHFATTFNITIPSDLQKTHKELISSSSNPIIGLINKEITKDENTKKETEYDIKNNIKVDFIELLNHLPFKTDLSIIWWLKVKLKSFDGRKLFNGAIISCSTRLLDNELLNTFKQVQKNQFILLHDAFEKQNVYAFGIVLDNDNEEILFKVLFFFDAPLNKNDFDILFSVKVYQRNIESQTLIWPITLKAFSDVINISTKDIRVLTRSLNNENLLNYNSSDIAGIGDLHQNDKPKQDANKLADIKNLSTIAKLKSDSINDKDHFNFDPDITAFAKVIASTSFTPPLAIALFGKWGMGKSFFMNSLMEKIKTYSKSQELIEEPIYCKGISHIHFNAWSYMDSNLWASLVSKIFEGLNEYIGNDDATDEEKNIIKEELSGQLEIIKEQRVILELNKKENETRIVTLNEQKSKKEEDLKVKLNDLKRKSITNVVKEVSSEFQIAKKLKNAFEKGVDKNLVKSINENIPEQYKQDPDLLLKELRSKRVFILQLLNKKNFWILIGIITFVIILSWIIPIIIVKSSPAITRTSTIISQVLITIFAIVTPIWNVISSYYKKLQPVISKIWEIKLNYDQKVAIALMEYNNDLDSTEREIKQLSNEIELLDELIFESNNENDAIEFKLKNNLSTLALHSFIEKRVVSADYQQHLGIVSTIRKDFKILSDLFLESKSEHQLDKPLERIVLYIDDLDRCPEDQVIQVLEAVNLLMAFPLFVVVVGVDPRWVNNALLKKYHLQFGECSTEGYERINASDYLEKIFQVPFHLKQAEDSDVKNMLKKLTENSVKKEFESQDSDFDIKEMDTAQLDTFQLGDEQLTMGGSTEDHQFIINDEPIQIDTYLSLRPEEIELMLDFSKIIGNNPRAIKRFVNTYQIVRAHEGLSIDSSKEQKEYLAIMFLLAFSLGPFKELYNEFGQYIDIEKSNMSRFLVESFRKDQTKNPELLKKLDKTVRSMTNRDALIGTMSEQFKKHNQFVKRFTFSY